jgi:hypothetical protein
MKGVAMRRATLVIVAVLLAVPAGAWAKAGVEIETDPAVLAPGDKTGVNMMLIHEPRGPDGGEPRPVVGVEPVATFRNRTTGEVVRVRGSRTNREGIAHATMSFPSKGDWSVTLAAPGFRSLPREGQEFTLGTPTTAKLVETASPPRRPAQATSAGAGLPWLILGLGLGAAVLLAAFVRVGPRRLRGLLPVWRGGGA